MKTKWQGDKITCDFCQEVHEWFVDGKTIGGPWAIMCPHHFEFMGVGLGTGRGQKYDAATLEKMEG
jgi:hypothetical protein